ncbi:methylated-DNA--[protein]-cysteine S-methyltransferase [Pseudomonas lalucatii]|uniref:Methylated-DNA--protein-cysteine methyltransferase n=1 Tax=Pseudomonas lalucatii TaxID=1424203 RepID=A0ABS5PXM1_9PSED|nr:methylated-DNA--[protein]-cysteine S-methyltransferase [Pseudomonas lalucatii]MBS7661119.1 methylated-DNA--[protein]-cysteine S-methyltransferase [Pseudomonas lalucatii]MBS7691622.1 methylated-DNA--[protein]-cysteine S-methyltransferase [Pseudomonas lalucatii]QVM87740.1 methylated-DNA--[protein]-cysteine S-methyltransferase [Pseudomonas lalucatii]
MHYRYHDSPLGRLLLAGDASGLCQLAMEIDGKPWRIGADWRAAGGELDEVCRQLDEYFAGLRRRFELPLAPRGTDFQRAVWQALQRIPYGRTSCYSALAAQIARPKAVRAVGAANGANPIAIVIPCHRVIGRDGSLTGYAGGLARKALLLKLEGVQLPDQAALAL